MDELRTSGTVLHGGVESRLARTGLQLLGLCLLCGALGSALFGAPLEVHYNRQTGEFSVTARNIHQDETKGQARLMAFLPLNPFTPSWLEGAGGAPQMTPAGMTQVSIAAFDPVNNALRVGAGLAPPGGQASPSDADQVFTSIFDKTYDAIRVNCVVGCSGGGGGGAPGGGNTAVQFNSTGAFGGDATNFYYNATTHSLGITGGLTLGTPLAVSSGGTGVASPSLAAGSNISVSGSWPDQTIALSGVIPALSLPVPTGTTLGGVESAAPAAHQWINSISAAGVPALSQPSFSDLSGAATLSQLPTTLTQFTGTITANDCAKWSSSGVLTDAGAACGSGGTGGPGGSASQYQFNNTTFGGAASTYNSTTAESTFPNINNIYYVDGVKYSSVEQVIADPNFKGGTIISTVPETFTSNPFQKTYYEQLKLIGSNGANTWKTNVHITVPAQDALQGSGWLSTIIQAGPGFPVAVDSLPTLGTLTTTPTGGSIPGSTAVSVVITAANANGETIASNVQSITTGSGTNTNTVTVPSPGAIANATGMNVYASSGGSGKYLLVAQNQPLTSIYTMTSIPASGTMPPTENTTANLISLASGTTGPGQSTQVTDLDIDCNGVDHGLGLFNNSAQEGSGAFWLQVHNCLQGGIDIEGPGAQNSNYQHLNIAGTSSSYETGINIYGAQIRGIDDATIVSSGSPAPAAISVSLGVSGVEACFRDIHVENFTDGLYFHSSPGCAEHVSGLSNVTNLVHIDSNSFDVTLQDIRPNGATNGIRDDTWTNPYQSGNNTTGFYSIGKGTGQSRTYLATDAGITPNFQNGLTSGVPLPVSSGGTGTAAPTLTAGSNISVSGAWPNQTVSFAGTMPASQPGGSNQFLTSYNSSTGLFSMAQPAFSNLSGTIAANQIASSPITNDCPQWNGSNFQWAACAGGSGAPGGTSAQYQINNVGSFGGSSTLTNSNASGTGTVQIQPSSDVVAQTVKCYASGQSDCFEIFNAAGTKSVWVDSEGNLNFIGNSASYGAGNQTTQSFLRLYGSVSGTSDASPAYLELFDGLSLTQTDLFASQSTTGLLCVGSGIPGGDCGPTTAGTNFIPSVAGGTAPVAGDCVKFVSSTQIGDAGASCGGGGGGGGSGTVNSGSAGQIAYYASSGTTVSGETVIPIANGGTGASTLAGANIPVQTGTITAGDCVKWASTTSITDAGACGSGGGGSSWSGLTVPSGNLTLNMAGYATTFNWGNAALGQFALDGSGDLTLGTSATSAVTDSPIFTLQDEYQSGPSLYSQGKFGCQMQPPAGTNPIDTLNCTYVGSSGGLRINLPTSTVLYMAGGSFTSGMAAFNSYGTASGNPANWQVANTMSVSSGTGPEYRAITLKVASGSTPIAAGQLVCIDTANANSVIVCSTSATNTFVGIAPAAISAGATGSVALEGTVTNAVLGTGTCSIGNYVIADTTTAGDVKCTPTFAAGTMVGFAMTAQTTVGSTLTVLLDKR